ncbi:MAG: integral rane sensor signal transduction histidine kinase [Clostridia bacterium]|jgi:signal transduction histidine kinase|nr:integral rane sensor signal transduction histidine kinase [Clostridia bacterium]
MNRNKIAVKLWIGIISLTIAILFLSMIFQTRFLYVFYLNMEIRQAEKDANKIANYIANSQYNFNAPYNEVIRRVNDIIIVTDNDTRIEYARGTDEYKRGNIFGTDFMKKISKSEFVHERNFMIRNMDTLLVGVPIIKRGVSEKNIKQMLNDDPLVAQNTKPELIGAVYIATPLEKLETTNNAIKLQFLYVFIGAIFLASLLSLLLSQSFSKPLILINNAAKEIAKGNYNNTINLKSSDEIKDLGETINNLSGQLSRVEKIRREFIANVSHEIRTPLSYLQGYTEILLDGLAESKEEEQKYLNIIMEESIRLKLMVNEILQLSQIEEGFAPININSFSMDALIKRTIDKVYSYAAKRNISIKFNNISDDLLLCLGDESRIKQVVINLLHNAIKHSYNYGNILINSYVQSDKIYICIRDFGEGIPQEDLNFIFDRFYTINKAKSEESSGLGLAIVKSIINSHGSEVTVNSVVGEGTEFCFWLPAYIERSDE